MPRSSRPAPKVRPSARVLLVDGRDRVLLFQIASSDPWAGGVWITPGGGVDPGEDLRSTAVRELAEETGLVVRPDQVEGPVWVRRHVGLNFDSRETFFLLRVVRHEVDTAGFTELERVTLHRHRWWSVPELAAATDEVFAPNRIAELLPAVLAAPSWESPVEVGV